jgi:hypothetical protein
VRCFNVSVQSSGVGASRYTQPSAGNLQVTRVPKGRPIQSCRGVGEDTGSKPLFLLASVCNQLLVPNDPSALTLCLKCPKRLLNVVLGSIHTAFMLSYRSYTITKSPAFMVDGEASEGSAGDRRIPILRSTDDQETASYLCMRQEEQVSRPFL